MARALKRLALGLLAWLALGVGAAQGTARFS